VEQSHHRLKRTVDQALMLRNSRDFESIQAYQHFLEQVIGKQNVKRKEKLEQERPFLKPLPQTERVLSPSVRLPHVERDSFEPSRR